MGKSNLVIEHECALNWLDIYAEMERAGKPAPAWKVEAMIQHERDLSQRISEEA